jgi:hypothetical protein
MPDSIENLLQQTESLREVFPDLGKQLGKAARRLELSGRPVPDSLLNAIADYYEDLLDLCTKALKCAETSEFSHLPTTDEITSFVDLEFFLNTLSEAQSEMMVFERVQSIAHCEDIELPSLQECQAKARKMRLEVLNSEWSTVSSSIQSLRDQKGPYSGLVRIIEQRETLDDTEWASIQEELNKSFGKNLATAAARGKLTFHSQEVTSETPLQIVPKDTSQQTEGQETRLTEEHETKQTEEQEVQESEEQTTSKTA